MLTLCLRVAVAIQFLDKLAQFSTLLEVMVLAEYAQIDVLHAKDSLQPQHVQIVPKVTLS
jgi:hypothetical protein